MILLAVSKEVNGITDKTLSKELKSLEANKLVRRDVYNTFSPTVEHSITPHGFLFKKGLDKLHFWDLLIAEKSWGNNCFLNLFNIERSSYGLPDDLPKWRN